MRLLAVVAFSVAWSAGALYLLASHAGLLSPPAMRSAIRQWLARTVFCALGLHTPCDGTAYSIRLAPSQLCPCSCHWTRP